jgi:NAD dependent epimerase/dehydratase family enzyme
LPVLCHVEWEAAAKNVPSSTRSVIIRTGIVLARDGGVLARMLPIFELFAGECEHILLCK